MPAVGRFRSARLLPGHYWVVALPGNNILPTFDREALEKLRASATSVTLTAGQATMVQTAHRAVKSPASGESYGVGSPESGVPCRVCP